MLQQQELNNPKFNTDMFLAMKAKARRYFFSERMNFGRNPTVIEILDYLRYYCEETNLPTIATVARWHSSWKRSN